MFGNYTTEAVKAISSERTERVLDVIKPNGGEVRSMYAVLGEHDLVLIVSDRNLLQNISCGGSGEVRQACGQG
jgi:uncharacterized protein with GYD domain